jgi:hypothetical protein
MIILVKDVIIMSIEGARDSTVRISRICMLDVTSCGFCAGSTLKPNLKGNAGSALTFMENMQSRKITAN